MLAMIASSLCIQRNIFQVLEKPKSVVEQKRNTSSMVTKSISSESEKTKDLSVINYQTANPNEPKTPQLCGCGQSNSGVDK